MEPERTYSFAVAAVDIYGNTSASTAAVADAITAATGGNGDSSAIIISEYIEGSIGHNKALEVVNISDESQDLAAYSL